MKNYNGKIVDIVENLETNTQSGLDEKQVQEREAQYGKNILEQKKKESLFMKFLNQFKDVMIIILLIAAVISLVVTIYENSKGNIEKSEFIEPIIIFVIVFFNAILGVFQENKAEKALEALKKMSAPKVKVIRNGQTLIIDSEDLVKGDLIVLEAGDIVPADSRLIESASLKCDESSLTGESLPVEKDALAMIEDEVGVGDRINMIFSGSYVNYGRAKAVVCDTGMNTEIGKIAKLLNNEKESLTPLQLKLSKLGKILGAAALIICLIVFIVSLTIQKDGMDIKQRILITFMMAVSLAVAAIPEGLPTIVTLVLAIGVQRMVKKNAIIRKLPAVETLGSASTICSDKTGTLTQNKMTVVQLYAGGRMVDAMVKDNDQVVKLLERTLLCCDGYIEEKEGEIVSIGDPTETAIVALAKKFGIDKRKLEEKNPRLNEIPFDSDRKLMSTICDINNKRIVIVKGAFDELIKRCVAGDKEGALIANEKMANDALRVIGVAYKEIDKIPTTLISDEVENELVLLGLVGMIDPPREEAKEAVKICIQAGIRPVMITGDHITTAIAIAKQIGIFNEGDKAITGSELDKMSDEELTSVVRQVSVYARVSPENKIRIVKAWQSQGDVVAMTGDGVNDAPALKAADIGCAMGITGTEVAKSASDMTLMDDNFATIVDAVKEGRGIYDNIKKGVQFLLSCNIGEILAVFLSILIWRETPLAAMQLLWINLLTDGFPAIALGLEKPEADVMMRKPRSKNESIFSDHLGLNVVLHGIYFGAITLVAFAIGLYLIPLEGAMLNVKAGMTMAFIVLSVSQLVHSFNVRTHKSLITENPFSNLWLVLACFGSFMLVVLAILVPWFGRILGLIQLEAKWVLVALALSISPLLIVEIEKLVKKIVSRRKNK